MESEKQQQRDITYNRKIRKLAHYMFFESQRIMNNYQRYNNRNPRTDADVSGANASGREAINHVNDCRDRLTALNRRFNK